MYYQNNDLLTLRCKEDAHAELDIDRLSDGDYLFSCTNLGMASVVIRREDVPKIIEFLSKEQ